jgi:RNA polymerase sigma factor (sigma-70 family)
LIAAPGRTGARTRLGTFDGSGNLFGWLAIIALRALAQARRERPLQSVASTPEPFAQFREDPADRAVSTEAGTHFGLALHAAWQTLNDRERIAVACKYGEGVKQEVIAVLLGVGPPRVSRILERAVAKIRSVIEAQPGRTASSWSEVGALREVLRDVVGLQLATSSGVPPPAGREDLDHDTARTR